MAQFLSRRWRQQPTYRAVIDRSNSLTRNILHAGTPHHEVVDAVGSLYWGAQARPPRGTGRGGLFWAIGPYSQYSIASPVNTEGVHQTVLWVLSCEYNSYTGSFAPVKGPCGGDNSGAGIGINTNGNIVYWSTARTIGLDTGVQIPLRRTSNIVLTSNASSTNIFLNGNKIFSSATSNLFYDGYYNSFNRLGYHDAYGNYISVQGRQAYPFFTYGVAQWARVALTDSEAASLSENPWQIFAPQKSMTVFLSNTFSYSRPIADLSNSGWVRVP
jgi:hypothetical protein